MKPVWVKYAIGLVILLSIIATGISYNTCTTIAGDDIIWPHSYKIGGDDIIWPHDYKTASDDIIWPHSYPFVPTQLA